MYDMCEMRDKGRKEVLEGGGTNVQIMPQSQIQSLSASSRMS